MEQKFKIGNIVKSKLGGPEMTVSEIILEMQSSGPRKFSGYFKCNWFDLSHAPHNSEFHQDELELVDNKTI